MVGVCGEHLAVGESLMKVRYINIGAKESMSQTGDVVRLDEGETSGDGSVPTAGYGN